MREVWIDSWKGLLIFLVVLGHVAGAVVHLTSGAASTVSALIYKWIYLFHMPAFFFLYGYVRVIRTGGSSPFSEFLKRKFRRLVVPYFFWGIVSAIAYFVLGDLFLGRLSEVNDGYYNGMMAFNGVKRLVLSLLHAGGWPDGEVFRSNSVLWFLPCMFTTSIAFECVLRCIPDRRCLLPCVLGVLALVAFAIGGVMRLHVQIALPWGMSSLPWWLAFMAMGGLFGVSGSLRRPTASVRFVFVALGTLLFTIITILLPDMAWAWMRWGGYLTAAGMGVAGCVLSLVVASFFDEHTGENGSPGRWTCLLGRLGLLSMGIMLIHKFPLCGMQFVAMRLRLLDGFDSGVYVFVVVMVSAAVVTVISYLASVVVRRCVPIALGERNGKD